MRYPPTVDIINDTITITDGQITFTTDGELLFDCDYEYESTDEIKACDWNNAVETFNRMATDPDYIFPI